MKALKILNFGSCNIDYVYNMSELVRALETISALLTFEHPGGKGLRQLPPQAQFQCLKRLLRKQKAMLPDGNVCVVLDTDVYNESDDQFAMAYSCD